MPHLQIRFLRISWKSLAGLMTLTIFLAACVKAPPGISNKPYTKFTARLIVTEPSRRWQVLVDWRNNGKDRGWLRLIHALTGRVVELRWQHERMWLRDNQAIGIKWREINLNYLASYGIPLFPKDVARFLSGSAPDDFIRRGEDLWSGKRLNSTVNVKWNQSRRILKITDIRNGKIAILMINE